MNFIKGWRERCSPSHRYIFLNHIMAKSYPMTTFRKIILWVFLSHTITIHSADLQNNLPSTDSELEINLFDETIFYKLLDEISLIKKPVRDPWMKENEYQKLLDSYLANQKNTKRLYKIDLGKIDIPCATYSSVCYDVESESIQVNIGYTYSDYERTFGSSSKLSSYEGQTIIQKNFDRTSSITKMERFEDKLVFLAPSEFKFITNVPINEMKTNFESFKANLIFSINLFDSHQLQYKRESYKEPTIDSPTEIITKSKEIYATMIEVILEKDGRPYVNLNPTYYPLYKVIPVYPRKARNKKLGGYVVTSFTIQKNGSVKNIKVIEGFCSSAKYEYGKFEETYECDLFNKSAIKATKKLSYPKQDQAINNAEHRFTFIFSQDGKIMNPSELMEKLGV